jgi:hypothetical protein
MVVKANFNNLATFDSIPYYKYNEGNIQQF